MESYLRVLEVSTGRPPLTSKKLAKEVVAKEAKLGYRLPRVLREIQLAYGTTDIQQLLLEEVPDVPEPLDPYEKSGANKNDLASDLYFFSGGYFFKPSEGDDPPVYYLLQSVGTKSIRVARSVSEFCRFCAETFEAISVRGEFEKVKEHFLLAEVASEGDIQGWSPQEIADFESENGIKLPRVFRNFLLVLGKKFNRHRLSFFAKDDKGNIRWSKEANRAELGDDIENIPDDAFIFEHPMMGVLSIYFGLNDGDNPPVYYAAEQDSAAPRFGDLIYHAYREGVSEHEHVWKLLRKCLMPEEPVIPESDVNKAKQAELIRIPHEPLRDDLESVIQRIMKIVETARAPFSDGKRVPVPETDIEKIESRLGYRLPAAIRRLYARYGCESVTRLLYIEEPLGRDVVLRLPSKDLEKHATEDMHFIDYGTIFFRTTQGDDPPVYALEFVKGFRDEGDFWVSVSEGVRIAPIARRLSDLFLFLAEEYEQLVLQHRIEIVRDRFVDAGQVDATELIGWTEAELQEFESTNRIKLPGAMRTFMSLFGKNFPNIECFAYYFSDLSYHLKQWSKSSREHCVTDDPMDHKRFLESVPDDAFFFWDDGSHGDPKTTYYFRLNEGHDPPVYGDYLGNGVSRRESTSFSRFVYRVYRDALASGGRLDGHLARGRTWRLYEKHLM